WTHRQAAQLVRALGSAGAAGRHNNNNQDKIRPRHSPVESGVKPSAFQRGSAMKLPRRRFLHLAAGAAALPVVSWRAWAQTYPSRPIAMIFPFATGGNTEVGIRFLIERLSSSLGQPIVLENRE